MKCFYKCISILLLYFFTPIVFAGVFDPPASDKSLEFLGMIFGSNVGTIYLGGSPNPVLSAMFEKFNVIVVSLGTIIVAYIGVVSTVNTAQEGEIMGKKLSSIWIPMRSILGLIVMVPASGSGYSLIQVLVMWIIINGIGAADLIWNIVLNNYEQGIGTSDLIVDDSTREELLSQGEDLSKYILESAVCIASLNRLKSGNALNKEFEPIEASTLLKSNLYTFGSSFTKEDSHISEEKATYDGVLNFGIIGSDQNMYADICGSYKIASTVDKSDLNSIYQGQNLSTEIQQRAEATYQQKKQALITIYNSLSGIAAAIVDNNIYPRTNNDTKLADEKTLSPFNGYILISQEAYAGSILSNLNFYKPSQKSIQDSIVDRGKRAGWISAASFYFVLADATSQSTLSTTTSPPRSENIPECTGDTCRNFEKISNTLEPAEKTFIVTKLADAEIYYKNNKGEGAESRLAESLDFASAVRAGDPDADLMLDSLRTTSMNIVNKVKEMLEDEETGDPLLGHAKLGTELMKLAEEGWMALIITSATASLIGGVMAYILPSFLVLISAFITVVTVVVGVLAFFWTLGATMAVYLPLVPYMMFTVTAVGWFILVIEAIIAAPITALGLVTPSGDEMGKIATGLMLLVGVFLRPTLMIFGFYIAGRLYRAATALVNFGMIDAIGAVTTDESILMPLAVLALYVGFHTALINKCFELIHIIPDRILRWVGGASEQTDTKMIQEAKGFYEKEGAEKIHSAASSFASGAAQQAGSIGKKGKKGSSGGGDAVTGG